MHTGYCNTCRQPLYDGVCPSCCPQVIINIPAEPRYVEISVSEFDTAFLQGALTNKFNETYQLYRKSNPSGLAAMMAADHVRRMIEVELDLLVLKQDKKDLP